MNCYFAVDSWMQFPPSSSQNSVRVISQGTVGVYVQAPIFPYISLNALPIQQANFPWIFSPPMPHLNRSAIRWIAVRWLPNKATQIRVNIDSSEWAHDSLGWHHIVTLLIIHILPSLFWQGGITEGKVKVGRERKSSAARLMLRCSCWLLEWRCRQALVSRLLMDWVNPALLVAVAHPHIRQRGTVSRHLCSQSVFMMICLLFSLGSRPPRRAFILSDGRELNTLPCMLKC